MAEFVPGSLREAVDRSVESSRFLVVDVDAGLVAAARAVADRIDEAVASADGQELTKALYLVPHITNLLREMLATPASRVKADLPEDQVQGKLAQLRAIRGGRAG